ASQLSARGIGSSRNYSAVADRHRATRPHDADTMRLAARSADTGVLYCDARTFTGIVLRTQAFGQVARCGHDGVVDRDIAVSLGQDTKGSKGTGTAGRGAARRVNLAPIERDVATAIGK